MPNEMSATTPLIAMPLPSERWFQLTAGGWGGESSLQPIALVAVVMPGSAQSSNLFKASREQSKSTITDSPAVDGIRSVRFPPARTRTPNQNS